MSSSDKVVTFPDLHGVEEQAAEWIVRFDDGEATAEDRVALRVWLDQSDHHRATFERLAALWGAMDIVEELNDYAEADETAALREADDRRRRSTHARRAVITAAAASLLLAAAAGVSYRALQSARSLHEGVYEAALGERRVVDLSDGSFIELNTNSRVEVSYSQDARNVRLVRGEAYFDVAPNPRRPFSVSAGAGRVTAVGTAFTVRLIDETANVVVSEGRVRLSAKVADAAEPGDAGDAQPDADLGEIGAGQNAVIGESGIERVGRIEPDALSRELSWREGMLAFSGEPLSEVVEDLSRYSDISIEFADASVQNLPVAGYFRIGEVDAMFEALEIMADVEVERPAPNVIRLSSAREQ
ncbi:MAG: FecR domain-containing protein [Maricaulaceae bacterium]|jgi:transmembrane sensor